MFEEELNWLRGVFIGYIEVKIRSVTRRVNHGNIREFLWTILPTFILIVIAIPSLKLLYLMDVSILNNVPVTTVKITGHQWFWSYEYGTYGSYGFFGDFSDSFKQIDPIWLEFDSYMLDEDSVLNIGGLRLLEVDNPLFIPIDSVIRFLITSVDVLHSWAVPSLGVKVDAVPGRLSQVFVTVKRPGDFYGQCSEICGVNHGFMPIKIVGFDTSVLYT